jgi:hypothetical protein
VAEGCAGSSFTMQAVVITPSPCHACAGDWGNTARALLPPPPAEPHPCSGGRMPASAAAAASTAAASSAWKIAPAARLSAGLSAPLRRSPLGRGSACGADAKREQVQCRSHAAHQTSNHPGRGSWPFGRCSHALLWDTKSAGAHWNGFFGGLGRRWRRRGADGAGKCAGICLETNTSLMKYYCTVHNSALHHPQDAPELNR